MQLPRHLGEVELLFLHTQRLVPSLIRTRELHSLRCFVSGGAARFLVLAPSVASGAKWLQKLRLVHPVCLLPLQTVAALVGSPLLLVSISLLEHQDTPDVVGPVPFLEACAPKVKSSFFSRAQHRRKTHRVYELDNTT